MGSNSKSTFSSTIPEGVFIKITDNPVNTLTSAEKVRLNRKGNELFNCGRFEAARRIFITTGYSDGLTRCGDILYKKERELDAFKLYWLAHNNKKSQPLLEKMAGIVSLLLEKED